jgi:hypothetical protein
VIKAVYPQARLPADPFHTGKPIWEKRGNALFSYRRQSKARGADHNDQQGIALAKKLWQLRWSLLKKPANVSVEEQQAMAALESEDDGFVPRFRSIIRQLVHSSAQAHSEARRS